ncbi:MAG: hypothetical protein WBX15_11040 [Thermoanaerobaculia bacterium]
MRSIFTAAAALILLSAPLALGSSIDFVIPAAGTGAGAGGSRWQSEITLHNVSPSPIELTMTLHDGNGAGPAVTRTLPANATVSYPDIFKNTFNRDSGTGAIAIDLADDSVVRKIAIASRTFNKSGDGEYGQDIPAVIVNEALLPGSTGVLVAPSDVVNFRYNFGIFALAESDVIWKVVRKDGKIVSQVAGHYNAGVQVQYNGGVQNFLGQPPEDNDTIRVYVQSGSVMIYGSIVDQRTGDPTYVPMVRTRINGTLEFLGVDMNEDGLADNEDLNYDGTLDKPIDIFTGSFPNFFRVIANDPDGNPITYTIVDPTTDMRLIDDQGTVQWVPFTGLAGTMGEIRLHATSGGESAELIVPVRFR